MATKITQVSVHPEFKPFQIWFLEKVNQFELEGDLASVDKFYAAQDAKNKAVLAAGATSQELPDGSIILSHNTIVPEFEEVFEQWIAQYNVQFTNEEV